MIFQIILILSVSLFIYYIIDKLFQLKKQIEELTYNTQIQSSNLKKCYDEIKTLKKKLLEIDNKTSSTKYTLQNDFTNLEKKVVELYERWVILADDRITSIPQTNKQWYEAKEIVEQPQLKVWKPKNLTQSKTSFVKSGYGSSEIDEPNQDFSEFSEEDFEHILEDEDTDSSSATDNTQSKKPKPKKNQQPRR